MPHILWIHIYLPTHEKLHDMVFVFSLGFLFAIALFRFRAGRHLPLNCCPLLQSGPSRLVHKLHEDALCGCASFATAGGGVTTSGGGGPALLNGAESLSQRSRFIEPIKRNCLPILSLNTYYTFNNYYCMPKAETQTLHLFQIV